MRIQFGYERFSGDSRDIRLTPLDQKVPDLPEAAKGAIAFAFALADARDIRPGDGEIDFPLDARGLALLSRYLPIVANALPKEGANLFVRIAY